MYEFLNNFHKRMEKLSYSFLIDTKVSTLTAYKNYFSNIELINLVYSLMCFVLERSLKDEECTLKNMAELLEELCITYYEKDISYEEAYNITYFIVYKILRNDGNPFVFTTIDYAIGEKKIFDFHLLQQTNSKYDNNKSTFSLTKEGYRLLLGALEMDEKTQIDINQMILELSLKKKNFTQGLMAVENLNNLITAQINVINNFILKVRENIFGIQQEDFEENFVKNIDVLKEQNQKFDELKQLILIEEERLYKSDKEITKDNYASLKQLVRIKELLISISYKASDLIRSHFHFKDEYKKALEEASFYYNNKRINIKEDLIKQVESNASSLKDIYMLFNPMFRVRLNKKFNINYIFNEQKLYSKDDVEEDVLIDELEYEDTEAALKKENKEQYTHIIASLLEFLTDNRTSDLRSLVTTYENKTIEQYTKLIPSIRKFSQVLIELLRIGSIDVQAMIQEQGEAYDNEEIEFDLRKLLVDEINDKYRLAGINFMHFTKCENTTKLTISERHEAIGEDEFITIQSLSCPNIIMRLE